MTKNTERRLLQLVFAAAAAVESRERKEGRKKELKSGKRLLPAAAVNFVTFVNLLNLRLHSESTNSSVTLIGACQGGREVHALRSEVVCV